MRIITKKEAAQMKTARNGKRSRVRAEVEAMEVGQILLLDKESWTRKTQVPNAMVRQIEQQLKREYTCARVIDGSGWLIERVA
jgi:hypothetical protein